MKIRRAIFFAAQLASGGVLAEGILVKLAKAAGCSVEVKYPLVDLLNRLAYVRNGMIDPACGFTINDKSKAIQTHPNDEPMESYPRI